MMAVVVGAWGRRQGRKMERWMKRENEDTGHNRGEGCRSWEKEFFGRGLALLVRRIWSADVSEEDTEMRY